MPRPGPRRQLLSARIDGEDLAWVQARAAEEEVDYPVFIRQMVGFARLCMPTGWVKPSEEGAPAPEGEQAGATEDHGEES